LTKPHASNREPLSHCSLEPAPHSPDEGSENLEVTHKSNGATARLRAAQTKLATLPSGIMFANFRAVKQFLWLLSFFNGKLIDGEIRLKTGSF
jgi:hypothetical protein